MTLSAKLSLALFLCLSGAALAQTGDDAALTAVTHDLCDRQVAMLGESATHGDGHTEAFKVALVQRLVNDCSFDAVYFEASHYEFLHLTSRLRSGESVSADDLASAIGGLWKFDREFQPLIPFLLAKVQSGKLSLGGIDDQLGQLGQDYSNIQLFDELTAPLPTEQRQACKEAFHRRIYYAYPKESPYSKADLTQLTACLSATQQTAPNNPDRHQMIASAQRWLDRDFLPGPQQIVARDRSMFQNFTWLRQQQSRRRKVILWAATVHIAMQADPTWADHSGENFGQHLHQEFGSKAFALGFAALTGSYRQGREVRDMPAAPPDSLEAQALQSSKSDAIYIGSAQLAADATLPGAIFRHAYQTWNWANSLNGVVVFREERPPVSTR